MNVKVAPGTVKVDCDTLNVTGTLSGVFDALAEAIWILPVRTCVVVSPVVFTDTVKFCGVLPVPGTSDNHELPDVTEAVRGIEGGPTGLVLIVRVWLAGAAAPVVQLKVMLVGLAVSASELTLSVTGMVAGLPVAPAEVTVTTPV